MPSTKTPQVGEEKRGKKRRKMRRKERERRLVKRRGRSRRKFKRRSRKTFCLLCHEGKLKKEIILTFGSHWEKLKTSKSHRERRAEKPLLFPGFLPGKPNGSLPFPRKRQSVG